MLNTKLLSDLKIVYNVKSVFAPLKMIINYEKKIRSS